MNLVKLFNNLMLKPRWYKHRETDTDNVWHLVHTDNPFEMACGKIFGLVPHNATRRRGVGVFDDTDIVCPECVKYLLTNGVLDYNE